MSNFHLSHIQHTEKTHTFIQSFKTYYFKARSLWSFYIRINVNMSWIVKLPSLKSGWLYVHCFGVIFDIFRELCAFFFSKILLCTGNESITHRELYCFSFECFSIEGNWNPTHEHSHLCKLYQINAHLLQKWDAITFSKNIYYVYFNEI